MGDSAHLEPPELRDFDEDDFPPPCCFLNLLKTLNGVARVLQCQIMQAAIKNRHRRYLLSACPFLRMCWVRSTEEDRYRRLRSGKNLVGEGLGALMASEFEHPDHEHVSIWNKDELEPALTFEQLQYLSSLAANESSSDRNIAMAMRSDIA